MPKAKLPRVLKTCAHCGREFDVPRWHAQRTTSRFFCCRVCYHAGRVAPLAERFRANVAAPNANGCHLWTGAVTGSGYGSISMGRKREGEVLAHRCAYTMAHGPIPPERQVCHRCDVRLCVNPDHLFLGTGYDNMRDMVAKGRGRPPRGEAHGGSKVTADIVREIRELPAAGFTRRQIGAKFGISVSQVSSIVARRSWTHV